MQTQSTNFQPQHASPSKDAKPLHIAVVGAGLAGFAVATGLRRQGHIVEVRLQVTFTLVPHANFTTLGV